MDQRFWHKVTSTQLLLTLPSGRLINLLRIEHAGRRSPQPGTVIFFASGKSVELNGDDERAFWEALGVQVPTLGVQVPA